MKIQIGICLFFIACSVSLFGAPVDTGISVSIESKSKPSFTKRSIQLVGTESAFIMCESLAPCP